MNHGTEAVPWRIGGDVVRSLVPALSSESHKGQLGRIGVVGGSVEYTGAPYYAAISALHVGADLAWIFTARDAAIPIKSYSPETIVIPAYDSAQSDEDVRDSLLANVEPWLDRMHGLVVGPGLGRREGVLEGVAAIVERAAKSGMPVVVDADGLFLAVQRPEIISGHSNVILTPNAVEFDRLKKRVLAVEAKPTDETIVPDAVRDAKELVDVCSALGGVTIIRKGSVDLISDGQSVLAVDETGSPRRCGGIGDVLAGATAVLAVWSSRHHRDSSAKSTSVIVASSEDDDGRKQRSFQASRQVWACYGASVVARRAAANAFASKHRGMTAPDIISCLADSFESLCPVRVI